jgi:hypothetical protein
VRKRTQIWLLMYTYAHLPRPSAPVLLIGTIKEMTANQVSSETPLRERFWTALMLALVMLFIGGGVLLIVMNGSFQWILLIPIALGVPPLFILNYLLKLKEDRETAMNTARFKSDLATSLDQMRRGQGRKVRSKEDNPNA